MRSFLGHDDFYRYFMKDFSTMANPLTNLLAKDVPFHFFEECIMAFTKVKMALTSSPVLHPPIWGEPFELMCDASNCAVGVILG